MKRFILRLLLVACAFNFVLPLIPGFQFKGDFWQAILVGVMFSVIAWVVEFLAVTISTVMTISTLGLALLLIIPLWIVGFWLLPAVILKLTADALPAYLAIKGWMPAILGGLVMLLVGGLTSDGSKFRITRL
jgi:Membrane protein of unknown function.